MPVLFKARKPVFEPKEKKNRPIFKDMLSDLVKLVTKSIDSY
jgi:hypothetical protein